MSTILIDYFRYITKISTKHHQKFETSKFRKNKNHGKIVSKSKFDDSAQYDDLQEEKK